MLTLNAVWFVTSSAWGADLSRALSAHAWPIDLIRRGLYLYLPEEAGDYVYLVSAGRLRIFRVNPMGEEKTIATLGPNDLFGELRGGPREFVLEAVEDLAVKTVDRRALEEHAMRPATIRLSGEGGDLDLSLPISRLLDTAPRSRLARVLSRLAEEYGVPTLDKRTLVPVKLTARALMEMTGLSEEAVREVLEELLAERVIAFEGGNLLIRYRAELERMTEDAV
ncbi:MAG: Crp/Fnr family transcriptional regulator [Blastocatellia bacterium]|nr:Crp/Fnr family transcriptional regulator [Blastocatellia bacterium]MCS7156917.1 Crp/Fnr family transcriptional regulator [Blastocatellia bacterium]MDW8167609.1 Crp/Fnr family transcriptional regulator [Acidobacteriota bacterium]MDW8256209.1 Crp/Fnr family transcriptional regulator [Acidobacteriota bacterium]